MLYYNQIRGNNPESIRFRKVKNMKNFIISILALLAFALLGCLAVVASERESAWQQDRLESQLCRMFNNCD